MKQHLRRIEHGFTLAEVMVALFILVSAFLFGTYFFASMARSAALTGGVMRATELAQDKLEELLELPFSDMQGGDDVDSVYRRTWSLSNQSDFVEIEVTVDWNVLEGHTRSVSLHTIRAN